MSPLHYNLNGITFVKLRLFLFAFQSQRLAVEHPEICTQQAVIFQFLRGPDDRGTVVEEQLVTNRSATSQKRDGRRSGECKKK